MKRIIALLMAVLLTLSLSACGILGGTASKEQKTTETSAEWKAFANEYKEKADEFVALYKKHIDNPKDEKITKEYEKLSEEIKELADRSEEVVKKISPTEAIEFAAEMLKIGEKLKEIVKK